MTKIFINPKGTQLYWKYIAIIKTLIRQKVQSSRKHPNHSIWNSTSPIEKVLRFLLFRPLVILYSMSGQQIVWNVCQAPYRKEISFELYCLWNYLWFLFHDLWQRLVFQTDCSSFSSSLYLCRSPNLPHIQADWKIIYATGKYGIESVGSHSEWDIVFTTSENETSNSYLPPCLATFIRPMETPASPSSI